MAGENLGALIGLWAEVVWGQRADAAARLVDEAVVWEQALGREAVHGRDAVVALLLEWDRPPRLTCLEATEHDRHVVLSSRGPDLHAGGKAGPEGESHLVFTFDAGRITRIRSLATRDEALAAVA
jgi:SnoaL-like protein